MKTQTKPLEILVVEDNMAQQEAVKRQFSSKEVKRNYHLTIVNSYQSAEEAIMAHKYDAVLTDLFMPFGKNAKGNTYPLNEDQSMKPEALGYPLALKALAQGIKNGCIVSIVNHHDGAMAASYERVADSPRFTKICDNFYVGFITDYPKNPNDKDWLSVLEIVLGKLNLNDARKRYGS